MESNLREIGLGHLENVAGICQENVAALFVDGHELVFPFLEVLQFLFVVTLHPTSFVEIDRFPTALGVVFVKQTVLDDFELKLSHGADNLSSVELVGE